MKMKCVKLNNISENEFVISHIYGGIQSSSINPFSANQTNLTNFVSFHFMKKLVKNSLSKAHQLLLEITHLIFNYFLIQLKSNQN